jgi:hypothetical protein
MSLHFTSNATLDIGRDLNSLMALDYFDQAPFPNMDTIETSLHQEVDNQRKMKRAEVKRATLVTLFNPDQTENITQPIQTQKT